MANLEKLFMVHGKGGVYRVTNTFPPPGERPGVLIDFSEDGGETWIYYAYIAPDCVSLVAEALNDLGGSD